MNREITTKKNGKNLMDLCVIMSEFDSYVKRGREVGLFGIWR
jgi:hypothetical protein